MFLLSGCINAKLEKNTKFCQLDQEVIDKNAILEKSWIKKVALKGGLSGADVYKVTDGNGMTYVFRNINHKSKEDKIREIYANKIASKYGYGAQLYAYDTEKGKIVISLLENSPKTLDRNALIAELAHALKKMHAGPAFCDHLSIIDLTKALYNKISHYPQVIDKNKISKLISQISYSKPYPKTATHRDLNPNNIFFTKTGVKFIDFENAGQDDPFFDIASIIIFYQYDDNAEDTFLKLYFGHKLSEEEYEHLTLMKKTVSLFHGLTLLSRSPDFQYSADKNIPSLQEVFNKIASGQLSLEREENIRLLGLAFLLDAINPT
jgi:thiamine kinase-like enzyme